MLSFLQIPVTAAGTGRAICTLLTGRAAGHRLGEKTVLIPELSLTKPVPGC